MASHLRGRVLEAELENSGSDGPARFFRQLLGLRSDVSERKPKHSVDRILSMMQDIVLMKVRRSRSANRVAWHGLAAASGVWIVRGFGFVRS